MSNKEELREKEVKIQMERISGKIFIDIKLRPDQITPFKTRLEDICREYLNMD